MISAITFKKKIDLNSIMQFFFLLIPILLITGPFLSDLAISLITIIFLFKTFQKNLFRYYKNFFFLIFLIFWFYILIVSILNYPNLSSIKISFFYFRFGIFFTAVYYLLEINKNLYRYFFYSILLSYLILVGDGYLQFYTGKNIIGYPIYFGRVSSFFNDELILGSYLSRLFPIFFGLTLYLNEKNQLPINIKYIFFIFILVDVLTFLSGERSAFFYINFSAIFMIIMIKNFKTARFVTLMISILIILLISIIRPNFKERMVDFTLEQSNVPKSENINAQKALSFFGNKYVFSQTHTHLYLTAYEIYKDHKYFGIGVKNFSNICKIAKYNLYKFSCSTHPHNTYIQIITETGIFGLVLILFIFFYIVACCFKHLFSIIVRKKYYFSDFQICMLAALLITLWPLIPSGNFFNNWLSIIYYLPVGFLLRDVYSKKSKNIN